ncbi:MAG: sulfur oxidation c-type cytochrome SoxA [Acidiferrobacterales bacterium]|nr:sulfur oxidation c-type cytochrome SoxA [Acidiferrobacterales bacterium]
MKKLLLTVTAVAIGMTGVGLYASPETDQAAFVNYFTKKFPDTPKEDFVNGVYSIDAASREQWIEIEEFPPYELAIDAGEEEWNTAFANGKGYVDCFGEPGVRGNYPYWDESRKEVITLELAINECREANGEKPLKYKRGKIADISAYMAYASRGEPINVEIPNDEALAAYERGKEFYYRKRGQLNFSCFDCHGGGAGNLVRADKLSPAYGHTSHFPVYRSKWGGMGTLHRRFGGCNGQVRAKSFKAQGPEYRELEYFLTYMSNGLDYNGPGARK